jgi:acyl-CoA synthetase
MISLDLAREMGLDVAKIEESDNAKSVSDVLSRQARLSSALGMETTVDYALRIKSEFTLPDGPAVHAVFVGIERAGCVAVGIGARAGDREVVHLLGLTGARTLVTSPRQHGRRAEDLRAALAALDHSIARLVLVGSDAAVVDPALPPGITIDPDRPLHPLGPDDLFLLNSTSGTTGLPKCVMHTQNRWFYFHRLAAAAGDFADDEVFFGALPAPFGFGLWTAHFTPCALGVPTVVMDRFDAAMPRARELLHQAKKAA